MIAILLSDVPAWHSTTGTHVPSRNGRVLGSDTHGQHHGVECREQDGVAEQAKPAERSQGMEIEGD